MYQVAEVVRNLAARNRDAALSAAERTMYERARINLVSEIAPALKVSAEEAEQYLDEALAKGVLSPPKEASERPRRGPERRGAAGRGARALAGAQDAVPYSPAPCLAAITSAPTSSPIASAAVRSTPC